ncbi:MAG: sensor domain-containing diguanylate cyclase [Desulfocapsaceae bacterium]|nr:sensor domain-containing diguanylate cyclase [Desulfocapsaceae bacterium]
MTKTYRIFDRRRLLFLLSLLLIAGFFATTLFGYFVSKQAIRTAIIGQNLPLTSSNIYSEIQKDLVRPVLISSTMAHDTFLREWVMQGEKDVGELARYLAEVKERYGAFSSFFVSEKSAIYYTGKGIMKHVVPTEPRDAWYYRVRNMKESYEINVDPDLANKDTLTIFINYRVFDFGGNYIGATGIGLTVDAVRHLIADYQQRYQRVIYFVNDQGHKVLFGSTTEEEIDMHTAPGLGVLVERILHEKSGFYQYEVNGDNYILNVNYLPELKWFLFVEQNEDMALAGIRRTLYINLAVSLAMTLLVLVLAHLTLDRYQNRIEEMATTDKLTGLLNRQVFIIFIKKLLAEYLRNPRPLSILFIDIDHFKAINDIHGHLVGDRTLSGIAQLLQNSLRQSDIAVRWGGEEFLVVLNDCDLDQAKCLAEKLRETIEQRRFEENGKFIAMTVSIGISQYDGVELFEQTISRADAALYTAKNQGRNCVSTAPIIN